MEEEILGSLLGMAVIGEGCVGRKDSSREGQVCAVSWKGENVGRGEKARDGILNYERVKIRARLAFKPVSRNLDFILRALWCR